VSELHIALMPGDGIGPEVTDAAVRVLQTLEAQSDDLVLRFETLSVGAGEYLGSGDPLPAATLERARACDAILLGAMGLPDVRWPNGTEMAPQIDIREQLDLYQGIRPVRLYHEALTPLREKRAGQIDLVIYRENTEALLWERQASHDPQADHVENAMRISRHSRERIVQADLAAARERRGTVTPLHNANVLPARALFREVFTLRGAAWPIPWPRSCPPRSCSTGWAGRRREARSAARWSTHCKTRPAARPIWEATCPAER